MAYVLWHLQEVRPGEHPQGVEHAVVSGDEIGS